MSWQKIINLLDVCRLVEFDKRAHPPKDQMTVDEYVTWLKSGLEIFALKDDENWIGSYQIIRKDDDKIFFAGFAVDPDFQGQGRGQEIMNHMINEFGHKNLICKTRENNTAMKSLLQKNGFFRDHDEVVSTDPDDHWTWWTRFPSKIA